MTMKHQTMLNKVILALDNMDEGQVEATIEKNRNYIDFYKIGLEQFCRSGPNQLKTLSEKFGVKFFLDLKLHDIPKTVGKAIESLAGLPITFLTIHLSGGPEMVREALDSAKKHLPQTTILGVSVLTSLDDQSIQNTYGKNIGAVPDLLTNIVKMGSENQLRGLVCSIQDLELVKSISTDFITVCPGIRFADQINKGQMQDQKRVATPELALQMNASYIVLGRAITQAKDNNEWLSRIEHLKSLSIPE